MAKYVGLINWTEQGIKDFKNTTERAKNAQQAAAKFGGKIETLLWTAGPYDLVTIMDFPDEEASSAFSLALGALGNVRTITMRAFDAAAMDRIIAKTR
ncbi:MAG: GYD domain-containing protein [Chloroflexi bacterium]|nr:MAG: GYD domain-containing protein [Chloroflexota bacterium]TMC36215.1 MAG: GYD domain-containing protein [Chloroflexota bacterium]TMC55124.1 MAG: GYD domain-containing protein [Chloroflexota bacterium]TME40404.1 MAG: GYD domain-containing protein [Chloroflexota bacterium]